jgi:hypothetical protein
MRANSHVDRLLSGNLGVGSVSVLDGGNCDDQFSRSTAAMGCLRVPPTVRCPVVQFNPVQQPFVAFAIVPKAGARIRILKVRFHLLRTLNFAVFYV